MKYRNKGGVLKNRGSALRTPENSLTLFLPCEGKKLAVCNPEEGPH